MRIFPLLSCLIMLCGCDENRGSDGEDVIVSHNDSALKVEGDSFTKRQSFLNAKWWLYCMACDKSIKSIYIISDEQNCDFTYGELDLEYKKAEISKEYISYFFAFNVEDVCEVDRYKTRHFVNEAITVKLSNDSVCAIAEEGNQLATWSGDNPQERLFNPLQPEVIEYIKKNKGKINPWFREEAIRRGVIKE